MEYDRTYWRACGTRRLIEAAHERAHDELTIALAERLDDLDDADTRADEMQTELTEADRTIDYLREQLRETEDALTELQKAMGACQC